MAMHIGNSTIQEAYGRPSPHVDQWGTTSMDASWMFDCPPWIPDGTQAPTESLFNAETMSGPFTSDATFSSQTSSAESESHDYFKTIPSLSPDEINQNSNFLTNWIPSPNQIPETEQALIEIEESCDELNDDPCNSRAGRYVCKVRDCRLSYSRRDSLKRHARKHGGPALLFSCPYCDSYDGASGFSRKDHVRQHIEKVHPNGTKRSTSFSTSCPHPGCNSPRASGAHVRSHRHASSALAPPFSKPLDFQGHMKKVHAESPFPCEALHCTRKGANGYFRIRDLVKHQEKEHEAIAASLRRENEEWAAMVPPYFKRYVT